MQEVEKKKKLAYLKQEPVQHSQYSKRTQKVKLLYYIKVSRSTAFPGRNSFGPLSLLRMTFLLDLVRP